MSTSRNEVLGRTGEDLACAELQRRGYVILARRYRTRYGEIDIVARDGGSIVFVEVKARTSTAFGSGHEAVTWRKQRRLVRAGLEYLSRHGSATVACRFDVVTLLAERGRWSIDIVRGAFDAGADEFA